MMDICVEEQEQEPSDQYEDNINIFDNLPDEVLEYIFKNLCNKDKCSLFLVCQRFNQILGNSQDLMKNFKLKLLKKHYDGKFEKKIDLDSIYETTRKYQQVVICNYGRGKGSSKKLPFLTIAVIPKLLDLFLNIGSTLRILHLYNFEIRSEYINKLLSYLPNLEKLVSRSIKYVENDCFKEKVYCPNLKWLIVSSSYLYFEETDKKLEYTTHPFFDVFEDLTTLHYLSSRPVFCPETLSRMKEFLMKQTQLEILDIHDKKFADLCDANFVQNIKFKLKSLDLICDHKCDEVIEFLRTQDKLTKISVNFECPNSKHAGLLLDEILSNSRNLEELKASFKTHSLEVKLDNRTFSNIQILDLKLDGPDKFLYFSELQRFIQAMPNLKSLSFSTTCDFQRGLGFLNGLDKLESLEMNYLVQSRAIENLRLKNLKNLKLSFFHNILNDLNPTEEQAERLADQYFIYDNFWIEFFKNHKLLVNVELLDIIICKEIWDSIENHLDNLTNLYFMGLMTCEPKNVRDKVLEKYQDIENHIKKTDKFDVDFEYMDNSGMSLTRKNTST